MTTRKRKDAGSEQRRSAAPGSNPGSKRSGSSSGDAQQALADVYGAAVYTDLAWFCRRDDGWLRVVPQPDELVIYAKFKYRFGEWAGHYHMVRVYLSQLPDMLRLLRAKVEHSDTHGDKRPSLDRSYGHDADAGGSGAVG